MKNASLLFKAVNQLYDAALDNEKWGVFLETACNMLESRRGVFSLIDVFEKKLCFQHFYGYDEFLRRPDIGHIMARVEAHIAIGTPATRYALDHPEKPFTFQQIWNEEDMHASDFYKEVMTPCDNEYALTVAWGQPDAFFSSITLSRRTEDPVYTQEDCDLLGDLVPHLKRATVLHRELARQDFTRRLVMEALEHFPVGIIIVNRRGNVRFSNGTANELSGDGLLLRGDHVSASRQTESAFLATAIQSMVDHARDGNPLPGEALTLTRPSGAPSLLVLVGSLWGNHVRLGLSIMDEPLAVLFVTAPDRPQEIPAEILQRLFGLTPAQARITVCLATGMNAEETAAELSLTRETVRSVLKIIYQKIGVNRQAELVNVVKSTPAWLRT